MAVPKFWCFVAPQKQLDTGSWRGGVGERKGAGLNTDILCRGLLEMPARWWEASKMAFQCEPRTLRPLVQTTRRPSRHCRHCYVSELMSKISQPLLWKNPKHMDCRTRDVYTWPKWIMTASTFVMMMATTLRPNVDSLILWRGTSSFGTCPIM